MSIDKYFKHCEVARNIEDDEMMCLTHDCKVCRICQRTIEENQILCNNCEDEPTNARLYAENN